MLAISAFEALCETAAVRCNAVRNGAAIAERCWSPRYIDLLKPLLRPPDQLQHDPQAWSAAFRVRACRLASVQQCHSCNRSCLTTVLSKRVPWR